MVKKLLCLLLAAMGGCVSGVGRERDTDGGDPIKALKHRLSEVRGLAFTAEVPIEFGTKERLNHRLEVDVQADQSDRKREDISLAYAKLGLLPVGIDLRRSSMNFYSSQIQGFYNSKTKKIVLLKETIPTISNSPPAEGSDTTALAHELTHALQDQQFSLGAKLRPSENGDRNLALRSVAEADATLSEYAYRFGGLQDWVPEYVRQILEAETQESMSPDVPAVIADKIRFQYSAGLNFVSRVLDDHGWLRLNLIYKYPPLSTEQILHPEKYFMTPDPPTHIRLRGLVALFPAEWREIENDTLGELMAQCLFKQFLGPEDAVVAAEGWGGDRFIAYRNGDEVAFIWATVWDSAKDATEFYDRYKRILSMKYRAPSIDSGVYIEKRDRSVIVIEGVEQNRIRRNIDSVWNTMVLDRVIYQPLPLGSSFGSH